MLNQNRNEIGSEFCDYLSTNKITSDFGWINNSYDTKYLLSGRTALDIIVRDIKSERKFKSVLIPSYCCDSMIKPFIKNNIDVKFYDVFLDINNEFDCNIEKLTVADAVICLDYFGFNNSYTQKVYTKFEKNDIVIINDATQSFLTKEAIKTNADYNFTSMRKWYATPDGAILLKTNGKFSLPNPNLAFDNYVKLRMQGFRLKQEYMNNRIQEKGFYFKAFSDASSLLEKNYIDYAMSNEGKNRLFNNDYYYISKKRQENAKYLINELKDISEVVLPFKQVTSTDVPLFVPIIVSKHHRNQLREYLVKHNVYCPIHWPISSFHNLSDITQDLYLKEISLVCDQRYNLKNMKKVVHLIKKFYTNTRNNEYNEEL